MERKAFPFFGKSSRIYCDTSVFGGCFDEEFAEASSQLFESFRQGTHVLVVSQTTLTELMDAPSKVRELLDTIPDEFRESIPANEEIDVLRDAYLSTGIVGLASKLDAAHIAAASVAEVDVIVSWNFKHIVHYEKILGYHGVNLIHGYSTIPIHSPLEVV